MAIQYTPALSLPYPEVTDAPLIASRDLRALAQQMDSAGAQIKGESSAALTASQAAEALAAQAVARADAIEDPIHVGPAEPTDGEDLWVDTDDDSSGGTGGDSGGGAVSSEDITDASTVGRAVLTAPLSVNARNALSIFTGSRALLDAGTDEAERTWDAKELHEYVTDTAAAAGGAASWDDLTGKPTVFPPSAHNHDDRYFTEAEVDAKVTAARPYDSGPRRFTPTGGIIDPANTGSIILHRIGDAVYCRIDGLMVAPGALDTWLWPNGLPAGFTIGEFGQVVDVAGGYTTQAGMNGAVRHRLTVYQNDLRYVGYLHGATATTVEASRSDQTRRIYGWLPAWLTPDPIPTTLVGEPV